jgi:hypothetical protein
MKRKKKMKAEYYSELHRIDELLGSGDHTMYLIMDAARRHNEELLHYLADIKGINYANEGKTALFWLAGEGDIRSVKLLIKAGAHVNAFKSGVASPLMHAAFRNRLEIVQLLVQNGAVINYTDADGDSALSLAEAEGHTEVVNYLKKRLSE